MSGIICVFNKDKELEDIVQCNLISSNKDYIGSIIQDHDSMYCVRPEFYEHNESLHHYSYFNKTIDIVFTGKLKRNSDLNLDINIDLSVLCDEEYISLLYCCFKEKCLDYLDGFFNFVIKDKNLIFAARDHLGIMPLYYYENNKTLIISSKIKCILDYLGVCIVDKEGIKELLGVGPSMSPGKTIYKNIYSLKPANYLLYNNIKLSLYNYWKPSQIEIKDDLNGIINHIKQLIIENTLWHYNNNCACLLSGGLDSSIIASILSKENRIKTYSLEYENQNQDFVGNEYQTTQDCQYIDLMNKSINNKHTIINVQQKQLYEHLLESLKARDMPGMSDIDSSLYILLEGIEENIIFSGECADEIFGGYPWFYKEELYTQNYFPWMRDIDKRIEIINKDLNIDIKNYILDSFEKSNRKDLPTVKRIMLLNYEWFMQTLLKRGETISNQLNKEIRMPFASKDILEYMYNVPDEYFFIKNEEKYLLRKAFEDILPEDIAHRKKNPFPKTYSPIYENIVSQELENILKNKDSILYKLFDKQELMNLTKTKGKSFDYPWYGQLMKGPQFIAYLIQIDLWAKEYNVVLEL